MSEAMQEAYYSVSWARNEKMLWTRLNSVDLIASRTQRNRRTHSHNRTEPVQLHRQQLKHKENLTLIHWRRKLKQL